MKSCKWLVIMVLCWVCSGRANAQVSVKDSVVFAPLISGSFGFQWPSGDLKDRFGFNSSVGGSFLIKDRHNWIYGVEANFLFGNKIEEDDVLGGLRTERDAIINSQGEYSNILLFERGFHISGQFGKLFPWVGPNPNSGFVFMTGVGLLQHKIRIQDNNNNTPQLAAEYKKGYDRLTNGLALSQFIGYRYFGNRRLINFYGGLEAIEAFTQNRRSYNFDTMEAEATKRTDLLFGFRIGWTIPLYKKVPREFYYD